MPVGVCCVYAGLLTRTTVNRRAERRATSGLPPPLSRRSGAYTQRGKLGGDWMKAKALSWWGVSCAFRFSLSVSCVYMRACAVFTFGEGVFGKFLKICEDVVCFCIDGFREPY